MREARVAVLRFGNGGLWRGGPGENEVCVAGGEREGKEFDDASYWVLG